MPSKPAKKHEWRNSLNQHRGKAARIETQYKKGAFKNHSGGKLRPGNGTVGQS